MFCCDSEDAVVVVVDSPRILAGLIDDLSYEEIVADPTAYPPLATPLS